MQKMSLIVMMLKTHLLVGLGAALYFLPHVTNKIVFLPAVIIASILPEVGDILTKGKVVKKSWLSTIIKTYTLCLILTVLLAFFYPLLALPFFLGYSFHLFLDTFTVDGVHPFWPIGKRINGKVRTGGNVDRAIMIVFAVFDFGLLVKLFI